MALSLVFMGTPDFAAPSLAELIGQGHRIQAVYTRAPKPKGRGLEVEKSPVHRLAEASGIEVRTPLTLKTPAEQQDFAALDADAAVVVAYGMLLPKAILEATRIGCFNLHGSLLPRWRGAAPIQRAIMADDAETGVMVMRMEEGLDTGPVLMAERTSVGRKTLGVLHDELAVLGANLLGRAMGALERGTLTETPQSADGVTYARKIEKSEARIDWTKTARELDCLIRGLSPFPGAWFEAPGKESAGERIKVLMAEPVAGQGAPGQVLDGRTIACGKDALRLLTVQRAGKTPMSAEEFARGFALGSGEILPLPRP